MVTLILIRGLFLYVLVNILILSSQRVTHKVGCLVTVYFHFDHPNKGFVLVYMYGLKYILYQPKGTRCNIVHAIYQTKESIAKLAKIFHSAADMSFVKFFKNWTVSMGLTIHPLGPLNVFL